MEFFKSVFVMTILSFLLIVHFKDNYQEMNQISQAIEIRVDKALEETEKLIRKINQV